MVVSSFSPHDTPVTVSHKRETPLLLSTVRDATLNLLETKFKALLIFFSGFYQSLTVSHWVTVKTTEQTHLHAHCKSTQRQWKVFIGHWINVSQSDFHSSEKWQLRMLEPTHESLPCYIWSIVVTLVSLLPSYSDGTHCKSGFLFNTL